MLVLDVILGESVSDMTISVVDYCLLYTHIMCSFFLINYHSFYYTAPLRRRVRFVRHEKGWMRRKRLKMERRYSRLQEGVEELKAYIQFKQEYKNSLKKK